MKKKRKKRVIGNLGYWVTDEPKEVPQSEEVVRGYKVLKSDWTGFGGFKYELGRTYSTNGPIHCRINGFHFCTNLVDCLTYRPNGIVVEVEALGNVVKCDQKHETLCCTDKIRVIRQLSDDEVRQMVNVGNGNQGFRNAGHLNEGNRNSGSCNHGTGNAGSFNHGDENTGDQNQGRRNSGSKNFGDCNVGETNSGNYNAGDGNDGDDNSGVGNKGDGNAGNYNEGWANAGNNNRGNKNSGDWNVGDGCSGVFNTVSQKMTMFNKPSDWTYTDWLGSAAYNIMLGIPQDDNEWISASEMTSREKALHPEYKIVMGYLKKVNRSAERQDWWDNLSDEHKAIVLALPNFDAEIFKTCTGIDVSRK